MPGGGYGDALSATKILLKLFNAIQSTGVKLARVSAILSCAKCNFSDEKVPLMPTDP